MPQEPSGDLGEVLGSPRGALGRMSRMHVSIRNFVDSKFLIILDFLGS